MGRQVRRALAFSCAIAPASTDALAHASDRGHVLLLPTGHYLAGGALAVAAIRDSARALRLRRNTGFMVAGLQELGGWAPV